MSQFKNLIILSLIGLSFFLGNAAFAQGHDHNHAGHDHSHAGHDHSSHAGHDHSAHAHDAGHGGCGAKHDKEFFNPGGTAFHHISDANVYSIGPVNIPLPCILYAPESGVDVFLSSKFHIGHHGTGHSAYKGYVLDEGRVKRVDDQSFPKTAVPVSILHEKEMVDGKKKSVAYACYQDKKFKLAAPSTADGGVFGGGITSFYDFSITKNVMSMFLVFAFLAWLFIGIAKKYRNNPGEAPSGLQGLMEPVFLFIQDEVAKPFLGDKYEKFNPLLMCLFFFILGLNLFGQIPFFGGSNVTGNLAFTAVLAIIVFIVTNINGNKHYWEHILWMPGVPAWVKTILTPVEILGMFIKPLTLMLRLFANITAGHMVMVIFVGLIFLFGQGQTAPSMGTAVGSTLLTIFMMAIELLVAFIQAFVFTILTASYIGAAIEDHGHAAEHH